MEASLCRMKGWCAIQDNRYWNVELEKGEVFDVIASRFGKLLVFSTKDGYKIDVRFHTSHGAYFNGYVTIPEYIRAFGMDPDQLYQYQGYGTGLVVWNHFNFSQEITFSHQGIIGWDHHHSQDGNLFLPLADQTNKHITGPVQVMEEAREFIHEIKRLEEEMKKQKTRERMSRIEEELIQRTCHPQRIEKWLEQGFDPFVE